MVNNLALPPLLYVASVIHTPDIVFKEVKLLHGTLFGTANLQK